jgi:hypothetical protein
MNGNMKCYSLLWFLYKLPVVLMQCCGSVTFWCGSGKPKKHANPTDPDPDADPEHWYIYIILQR